MPASSPSILITGVSSGLGLATARAFLARGYRVFGSLRRPDTAAQLQAELGPQFVPLLFDVTDTPAIAQAVTQVTQLLAGQGLAGLINNAGVAFGGPLQHQPMEVVRQHFDVNVMGLVQVTQAFLPLLGATPEARHTPGRILNISSVSGKIGAPFVGAYVGSKHAVEGLTESWRRELRLFEIDMILIGLGVTETAIWDKGIALDSYRETPYFAATQRFVKLLQLQRAKALQPDAVAARLLAIFEARSPRPRYAIVPNRLLDWTLPRLLPSRWLDGVISKQLGLRPRRS